MSTETQEKIAKILGYKESRSPYGYMIKWISPSMDGLEDLPDWENDMKACRELWEFIWNSSPHTVVGDNRIRNAFQKEILDQGDLSSISMEFLHVCELLLIPPAQHCAAFLKAMGAGGDEG